METLTREQRRSIQKEVDRLNKLPPGKFTAIDMSMHPHPKWMSRAYRNNRYTVMIDYNCNTTHGKAIKAMVQKHGDVPIPNHWSEMQAIKNEIFGPEVMAIEYYPKESELVDQHNIYWLWIFPEGIIPVPS
jgi:hypothetical protein